MNNCAVLATKASQQSNQSGVALTSTLLELLTIAQSKVEVDRKAAQACLSRATALLEASLERNVGPKAESTFRGGLPRWQAKRLTTFIEENLEQPIRSPDLIAITGLSTGHFFRTFKETFGQAPFAYIAKLRIERAQQMMLTTNHSLSQIALDCGMCDQSHLTRLFRQFVGMTPGEWRRVYACESFESTSVATDVA
ncbi:AraC family transcriptional regulator [Candidimonas sp. SYP-B2681]|uniref:helix-turn-helix domain-containing protein n=1 Tax=Candidimonas sp. SYP-B2681 TaxID=2497686 RepID=UPI000F89C838|nr:AraC family transcriptional regulator [Candidimonas sp. SYP-B2681]RTZ47813.1 AraC family transcriptional regulator [Candidimonas sp. SYP-B2681]